MSRDSRQTSGLIVKLGSLLDFRHRGKVVLDPELGAGFLQKRFDRSSRGGRLRGIEFRGWDLIELSFLGIVIEVATQNDRTCLRQFQKQHLMPRRVSWRLDNRDRTISKEVDPAIDLADMRGC